MKTIINICGWTVATVAMVVGIAIGVVYLAPAVIMFCVYLIGVMRIGNATFNASEVTAGLVWYATWQAVVGIIVLAVGIGIWEAWKQCRFLHIFGRH